MKFETNLPLRDTFHKLNEVMDKVEYKGSRYLFESSTISGVLLQGNLQAGLEFRLSEISITEKVEFIRRRTDAPLWYMDITVGPSPGSVDTEIFVNFHNRKEEGVTDVHPATIMSCNYQIAPAVMVPFYLGKYERIQAIMDSGTAVNLRLPALESTKAVMTSCLAQRIESVLHSRVLHNRLEGLFLSHLARCWDELLTSGGA